MRRALFEIIKQGARTLYFDDVIYYATLICFDILLPHGFPLFVDFISSIDLKLHSIFVMFNEIALNNPNKREFGTHILF